MSAVDLFWPNPTQQMKFQFLKSVEGENGNSLSVQAPGIMKGWK